MRKDTPFPMKSTLMTEFLEKAWNDGWLDAFSDEHFLIRALEGRLQNFVGMSQLTQNNLAMFCPTKPNGDLDLVSFCNNFCINLSMKLAGMSNAFGEDAIKHFIVDQLSAGKQHHYKEDAFLQALSEISILSFWLSICHWNQAIYEPPVKVGSNNKNPEASFIRSLTQPDGKTSIIAKINVEVKSPAFPHNNHINEKILIPSVLLTEQGRAQVQAFCQDNGVTYLPPRVKKLVDFINSATEKFEVPTKNELNLLYINWTYRDYPSNSFLEAASLLSNPFNGLLYYPDIAQQMGVSPEAFKKISAIIVYTESLEGVMFTDYRHIWQRHSAGPRFRIYALEQNIKQDIYENSREFVFQMTGMNPCEQENYLALIDFKSTSEEERKNAAAFGRAYKTLLTDEVILLSKQPN